MYCCAYVFSVLYVSRLRDDEKIADIALQKYFLYFFFIIIIFIFYSFSSVDRVYYHLSLEVLAILMILQKYLLATLFLRLYLFLPKKFESQFACFSYCARKNDDRYTSGMDPLRELNCLIRQLFLACTTTIVLILQIYFALLYNSTYHPYLKR